MEKQTRHHECMNRRSTGSAARCLTSIVNLTSLDGKGHVAFGAFIATLIPSHRLGGNIIDTVKIDMPYAYAEDTLLNRFKG
jgi:hypothetical protein